MIVDDANDFDSPVIDENATYSSLSEQQSFTTNASAPGFPPCIPLLSTPLVQTRSVSTNPTFSWQAAVNADYYQLIVSTKDDLSDPVFDENNITSTSKTITGLDEGPIFYWKVVAHNTYGGTYSSIRNFTMD